MLWALMGYSNFAGWFVIAIAVVVIAPVVYGVCNACMLYVYTAYSMVAQLVSIISCSIRWIIRIGSCSSPHPHPPPPSHSHSPIQKQPISDTGMDAIVQELRIMNQQFVQELCIMNQEFRTMNQEFRTMKSMQLQVHHHLLERRKE